MITTCSVTLESCFISYLGSDVKNPETVLAGKETYMDSSHLQQVADTVLHV